MSNVNPSPAPKRSLGGKRLIRKLTFFDLFKKIQEIYKQKSQDKIRIIANEWRLKPDIPT